jgi:hypothetical protein
VILFSSAISPCWTALFYEKYEDKHSMNSNTYLIHKSLDLGIRIDSNEEIEAYKSRKKFYSNHPPTGQVLVSTRNKVSQSTQDFSLLSPSSVWLLPHVYQLSSYFCQHIPRRHLLTKVRGKPRNVQPLHSTRCS